MCFSNVARSSEIAVCEKIFWTSLSKMTHQKNLKVKVFREILKVIVQIQRPLYERINIDNIFIISKKSIYFLDFLNIYYNSI